MPDLGLRWLPYRDRPCGTKCQTATGCDLSNDREPPIWRSSLLMAAAAREVQIRVFRTPASPLTGSPDVCSCRDEWFTCTYLRANWEMLARAHGFIDDSIVLVANQVADCASSPPVSLP